MFGSSHRTSYKASERHIARRRADEDKRASVRADVQRAGALGAMANWEQKSSIAVHQTQVRNAVESAQRRRQEDLNKRRQQLRSLLAEEEAVHLRMVNNLQESPEERKDRLTNRALQLKAERESRRTAFVQEATERRFRQGCDDLRANEGKNLLMQCQRARQDQIEQRGTQNRLEQQEKAKFAAQWRADYENKCDRDAAEHEARIRLDHETYSQVDAQVADLRRRQQDESAHREEQKQHRLEQLQEQEAERKRDAADAWDRKQQRKQEVDLYTNEANRLKNQMYLREREADVAFIRAVLERESQERQAQAANKVAIQKDIQNYLSYLDRQKREEAVLESHLEKLRSEELDKEWQKRELKWERERLARQNLLKAVCADRRHQIAFKEHVSAKEKEEDRLERLGLEQRLAELSVAEKALEEEEHRRKMQIKEEQLNQISHKEYLRDNAQQFKHAERQQIQQQEEQYQQKVRGAMQHDEQNMRAGKGLPDQRPRQKANWWTY